MASFSPEDIKINSTEGVHYSDIWALTCAQLGETVSKLLVARPSARLTQGDLTGYHFIQYGIGNDTTREVVDCIQGGMWSDWDGAEALRNSLPQLLDDQTRDVVSHRIRLGDAMSIRAMQLDPTVNEYFDREAESDHVNRKVMNLYPKEGVELEYCGRVSVHIGSVAIDRVARDLTTHTDVLHLKTESSVPRTLVALSTNLGLPAIESLRLL